MNTPENKIANSRRFVPDDCLLDGVPAVALADDGQKPFSSSAGVKGSMRMEVVARSRPRRALAA